MAEVNRGGWKTLLLLVLATAGLSCVSARIPKGGSREGVVFYAAPTELIPGARFDAEDLEGALRRLGYRQAEAPLEPGQYAEVPRGFEIHLRPFHYPDHEFAGGPVRVRFAGGEVISVESPDGSEVGHLSLEPERIAGFVGETGAVLDQLPLSEAPPLLVEAILAVEDRRFWKHPGFDPFAAVRALVTNVRRGEAAQGGSTLTQQLARSLFLHNRKTMLRKVQELYLAVELELRYSKDEILESYLNAVYWGHWGSFEIRGAREASRYYLGRELEEADPAGLALLAGLIRAPNLYSPYSDAERARKRRDQVLGILRDRDILSEKEYDVAIKKGMPSKKPPMRVDDAPFSLEAARQELERRAPAGTLDRTGISIFTTLDLRDQAAAVTALRQGLERLERRESRLRRSADRLEGAVVVIDPASGEVKALVGGRDFQKSSFNRATQARRQPGSLFKPFVYLAAFRQPLREDATYWTPATLLVDEPFEMTVNRKIWHPENYDHEFRGEVTVRQAIEQSLNVPTARVGAEVGPAAVAEVARDLGIASPLDEVPSIALGTSEVTLMEITGAYAALADGGRAHTPTLIRACMGPDGELIPLAPLEDPPGVEPAEAYVMSSLLEGVINSGTGRPVRDLGVPGPVAGKTGTTDDYRDAWFVGYDPYHAIGVWVGFDREGTVGLSGAAAALPIWARTFLDIRGSGDPGDFPRPDGVISATICPETGLLASNACLEYGEEVFLAGTEPYAECSLHGGLFDGVRRFFGF